MSTPPIDIDALCQEISAEVKSSEIESAEKKRLISEITNIRGFYANIVTVTVDELVQARLLVAQGTVQAAFSKFDSIADGLKEFLEESRFARDSLGFASARPSTQDRQFLFDKFVSPLGAINREYRIPKENSKSEELTLSSFSLLEGKQLVEIGSYEDHYRISLTAKGLDAVGYRMVRIRRFFVKATRAVMTNIKGLVAGVFLAIAAQYLQAEAERLLPW